LISQRNCSAVAAEKRGVSVITGIFIVIAIIVVVVGAFVAYRILQSWSEEKARVEREAYYRALEDLKIPSNRVQYSVENRKFSIEAQNIGGVDVTLTGVMVKLTDGTILTRQIDNVVIPAGGTRIIEIDVPEGETYNAMSLISARGNTWSVFSAGSYGITTIISGSIVDNQTGRGVPGAIVRVKVWQEDNEWLYLDTVADNGGGFSVSFPSLSEGEYKTRDYFVTAYAVCYDGYDDEGRRPIISGTIMDGDAKYAGAIGLQYDPFDVYPLEENITIADAMWGETVSERRYEYRLLNTIYGSKYNVRLVGGHMIYTNQTTTDPNYYRVEDVPCGYGWSGDYDYYTGEWVSPSDYIGKYFTASSGSEIGLHSALRNVTYRVDRIVYDSYTKVYRAGYWTLGGYRIYYVPCPYYINFCDYYVGGSPSWIHGLSVPPQTFVITEEESRALKDMPDYASNGSFVRVDAIDHVLLSGYISIGATVVRKNGFDGQLSILIQSSISSTENLIVDATENLVARTLRVSNVPRSGSYRITLQAFDSSSRFVEEKGIAAVTPVWPSSENREYLLYYPEAKIVVTVYDSESNERISKAAVVLYTYDGSFVAAGRTDENGVYVYAPSEWPINESIQIVVSHSAYYTAYTQTYTGRIGVTIPVSVQLKKTYPGRLDITVLSASTGKPVSGARVRVQVVYDLLPYYRTADTSYDGKATFLFSVWPRYANVDIYVSCSGYRAKHERTYLYAENYRSQIILLEPY